MGMDTISPKEAIAYIGRPDVLFIDLREEEEYRRGHIPGAVLMEADDLVKNPGMLTQYRMVILYCDRGNTSLLAARDLMELPVKIRSIAYGMQEYRGPVEKEK